MENKKHSIRFLTTIAMPIALYSGCFAFSDEILDISFALPMQAHLCEVAGVGTVTGVTTNGFTINVDTWLWNENSATNPLHVAVNENVLVPTNTPIAFLASTVRYSYGYWLFDERLESLYSFMFKMHEMVDYTNMITRGELRLIDDERSWFRADEEDGKLLTYTSNLVHYAKVNTNEWEFYKVIRNSAAESGEDSKVYEHSYYADFQIPNFFTDKMAERVLRAKFRDTSGGKADSIYINRFGTNIFHEIRMSEPVR